MQKPTQQDWLQLRTCICRLPGHKLLQVGHPGLVKALRHSWGGKIHILLIVQKRLNTADKQCD